MQVRTSVVPIVVALASLSLTAVLSGTTTTAAAPAQWTQGRGQVEWKVDTGDYEVVANWPKPLVWNGRTQKLRPKPNADPGKIVGPPVGGWPPQ